MSREYRLPHDQTARVESLVPQDAEEIKKLLAVTWQETYVAKGLMTAEQRYAYTNFEPDSVAQQQEYMQQMAIERQWGTLDAPRYLGIKTPRGRLAAFIKWHADYSDQPEVATNPNTPLERRRQLLGGASVAVGMVEELDVHPKAQRRKFGSAVCHAALTDMQAMGLGVAQLWVVAGNTNARRYYDAIGFSETGVTSDFPGLEDEPNSMQRLELVADIAQTKARIESKLRGA